MLFSGKDLRKLIIPLMFEQLLAVLVGLVDTLMVSQSGEAAVAGVALVDNINRLIIQVMAALATGGAVVCSQYIGKGRDDESRKSGAQLETVLLIFSVIMTAFQFHLQDHFLRRYSEQLKSLLWIVQCCTL